MTSEAAATSATLLGEPLPVELMNTVSAGRGGVHDALEDDGGAADDGPSPYDLLLAALGRVLP